MEFSLRVKFERGYIAHPYWPERERLINVQKESGMNRVRDNARREASLKNYLQTKGLTLDDYRRLEELADRQFYMGDGHIVIPAHQVYGCLAQASDLATRSIALARRDQLRSLLWSSDWMTPKMREDGVWDRMVVVTAGTGAKLSNQRALRSNAYIADFEATGSLRLLIGGRDEGLARRLKDFLAYAGREIGIGASRKMGWGRFELLALEETT